MSLTAFSQGKRPRLSDTTHESGCGCRERCSQSGRACYGERSGWGRLDGRATSIGLRREEALNEYYAVQAAVRADDDKRFQIKSWSVTVTVTSLARRYFRRRAKSLSRWPGASLVFWIVDGLWKSYQIVWLAKGATLEQLLSSGDLSPIAVLDPCLLSSAFQEPAGLASACAEHAEIECASATHAFGANHNGAVLAGLRFRGTAGTAFPAAG